MQKLKRNRRKTKITIVVIVALLLAASVIIIALSLYGKTMMKKIPGLSFGDALSYTLKDNRDAVITVGIVKDGQLSYIVYGNNTEILPLELHTYEIGSLTKTFTAAMIAEAVQDGKINVNDTIDCYLTLPDDNNYPTIADLLTHTSDYKPYYFEWPMVSNILTRKNDFYGITKDMFTKKLSSLSVSDKKHEFKYSNFGYAALGLILEEIYNQDYASLMDEYINNELHLQNTQISDKKEGTENYWTWNKNDAYLPAGGILSDMEDMLAYAKMQLDEEGRFGLCHEPLKKIDATSDDYEMLNIHLDSIGMAWIIDEENGIIWHNGGTDNYNSYLGFDPESGTAVVILSNLSPDYGIPSTVLGVKLMEELRSQ